MFSNCSSFHKPFCPQRNIILFIHGVAPSLFEHTITLMIFRTTAVHFFMVVVWNFRNNPSLVMISSIELHMNKRNISSWMCFIYHSLPHLYK
mmetsp:Transcript_22090/g.53017  ORF Transcript_22090/g.53017 Transcript_22090/m.53017 type:complete len:92 (+) Transcript_22090:122-397(+)